MTNFEKWKQENKELADDILFDYVSNKYGVRNNELVRCMDMDCRECDYSMTRDCDITDFLNLECKEDAECKE